MRFLIFLPYLLLTFLTANGQIAPAIADKSPKLGFRTLGWMTTVEDLHYELAGKPVKISVNELGRSELYARSAAQRIVFFRIVQDTDGRATRQEAGAIELNADDGPTPLLVFLSNPEATNRYRIVALSDDIQSFPAATFRFINLTPVGLKVTLGDQTSALPPNAVQQLPGLLSSPDVAESRFTTISAMTQSGPMQVYGNNWVVRPSQRALVFIVAANGSLQVHRIVDDINAYLPPPPPPR